MCLSNRSANHKPCSDKHQVFDSILPFQGWEKGVPVLEGNPREQNEYLEGADNL
jgi:hypothetical protein